jgi:hypothetical protein
VRSSSRAWSVATALLAAGCAQNLAFTAAPTVDATGTPGGESSIEFAGALGDLDTWRLHAALETGAGYLGRAESGYLFVAPELGAEVGSDVRFTTGLHYIPRFVLEGNEGVVQGGGVTAQVMFPLTRGRASWQPFGLGIGPRVSAELIDSAPGSRGVDGLFELGCALRWYVADDLGRSWLR